MGSKNLNCDFFFLFCQLGLNKFIETLDRRLEKTCKDISGLVAKKERVVGEPSSSSPVGAPSWALSLC